MYQGHATKAHYVEAWKSHARELRWMFWETAKDSDEVDAKMNAIYDAIDAAADKLEAAGKFVGE